jgi:SAM-dependent methyltransferase
MFLMPTQSLDSALGDVRDLLLDRDRLVRAVAAGHRRGRLPSVVRAEMRPVALTAGPRLQVVTSDGTRPHTRNVEWGEAAEAAVDSLLSEPFGNWHVETTTATVQLRVTKKGMAQVHSSAPARVVPPSLEHDRAKAHLIDPGDPLFDVIGGSGAKRRQVDAFLRSLAAMVPDREPNPGRPLRVMDLGCGNAYLTFAAYRYLSARGLEVDLVGVDIRADQCLRNTQIAEQLGWADRVRFVRAAIADAQPGFPELPGGIGNVDVVLALHACDTATDEALERAVTWRAISVLAAPCCHHDIASQLRGQPPAPSHELLTNYPILRERFADVLTDALRAALLRLHGYSVDIVEFVDSAHTPRNLLVRARMSPMPASDALGREYESLVTAWGVTPRLATLLGYQAAVSPDPGKPPRPGR